MLVPIAIYLSITLLRKNITLSIGRIGMKKHKITPSNHILENKICILLYSIGLLSLLNTILGMYILTKVTKASSIGSIGSIVDWSLLTW